MGAGHDHGGGEISHEKPLWWALGLTATFLVAEVIGGLLTSPDYSIKDVKAIVLNGYLHNQSLLNEMMEIDLSQELQQVQIPYLIMQGDKDIVTPTKAVERLMAENHNDNLFFSLVENSAHMPSAKAMERIQTEGISFLKK